ncbi:MAG: metalloregulator ArsR/SmtB family transcription factor [Tateyamaria sp.]|uniref:ArsR/SmtB family transcription factor n=1 Tax=Tateyamaria sp. TaxID=1929288 RepID=UPI00326BE71B
MANQAQDDLSPLFAALADPTRRAVIKALSSGPRPVSHLAEAHDMALPSFLKHIDKLERAGVIATQKSGRVRTCHLHADALAPAQDWLAQEAKQWGDALDRLSAHLDAVKQEKKI